MGDEDTSPVERPVFRFRDTVAIKLNEAGSQDSAPEPAGSADLPPKRQRRLRARASNQEWTVSAVLLLLDVVAWFVIYGFTSLVRGDAYYSIGGYDRSTETRSLVYATEHLLAVISAVVVSAALIYSAAGLVRSADCGEGG